MTGNKLLLDTNIITAWLKGEVGIAEKIEKAKEVHLSITVIGEIFYGAHYSTKIQKNLADIKNLLAVYNLLYIDENVAEAYGRIKAALRKKGKPIPENDIWIAATASAHQLVLVTRDKHFKEIDAIKLKYW
jgi:tRNA(fMet)-specific endonuclease VapC